MVTGLTSRTLMEVDDTIIDFSAPLVSTSQSQRQKLDLSDEAIQRGCRKLERFMTLNQDDESIRINLAVIWYIVKETLAQHGGSRAVIVSEEDFEANVKDHGEKKFITFLRDVVKRKSWRDLLCNGTYPLFMPTSYHMKSVQRFF
jgi:hypothetical protein